MWAGSCIALRGVCSVQRERKVTGLSKLQKITGAYCTCSNVPLLKTQRMETPAVPMQYEAVGHFAATFLWTTLTLTK